MKTGIIFWQSIKPLYLVLLTNGPTSHQLKKITSLGLKMVSTIKSLYFRDNRCSKTTSWSIYQCRTSLSRCEQKWLLMIGDDLTNDIEGAKNRDWNTIYFKFGEEDSTLIPTTLKPNSFAWKNFRKKRPLRPF